MDNKKNSADGTKPGPPAPGTNASGIVIMTGVAKKKVDKRKGELIEQNQDGLEVSGISICFEIIFCAVCCACVLCMNSLCFCRWFISCLLYTSRCV